MAGLGDAGLIFIILRSDREEDGDFLLGFALMTSSLVLGAGTNLYLLDTLDAALSRLV